MKRNQFNKVKSSPDKAPGIDVTRFDDDLISKCMEIALDFQNLDEEEREIFVSEQGYLEKSEKLILVDTCIRVLEVTENYELCAMLHRMRLKLI